MGVKTSIYLNRVLEIMVKSKACTKCRKNSCEDPQVFDAAGHIFSLFEHLAKGRLRILDVRRGLKLD